MSDCAIIKEGKVVRVSMLVWATWIEKNSIQKVIGRTNIGDVLISTVFLGLNHGFGERDLWFETMVFGGTDNEAMERYETLDQAKHGHEKAVRAIILGQDPFGDSK